MKLLATIPLFPLLISTSLSAEEASTIQFDRATSSEMLRELNMRSAAEDLSTLQQRIRENPQLESEELLHSISMAQDKIQRSEIIEEATTTILSDEIRGLQAYIRAQDKTINALTKYVQALEAKLKELTNDK
ncbi:hypothetical protein [Marinobacter alexandrii]|uniref:hypothetical protein n=1 Tax=Marinobacter alexandrii TaxID=2570351 RepID=UPI00110A0244|nr:hypothetical protein [Marinobacter alexandrii]